MWFNLFRSSAESSGPVEMPANDQPRAKRFRLDTDVSFVVDGSRHEGRCINVSESGLLAGFDHPPDVWVEGKVELEAGGHYLDIHVRVARVVGNDVGFAFCLDTENDRAAIRILIDSVSGSPLPSHTEGAMIRSHCLTCKLQFKNEIQFVNKLFEGYTVAA